MFDDRAGERTLPVTPRWSPGRPSSRRGRQRRATRRADGGRWTRSRTASRRRKKSRPGASRVSVAAFGWRGAPRGSRARTPARRWANARCRSARRDAVVVVRRKSCLGSCVRRRSRSRTRVAVPRRRTSADSGRRDDLRARSRARLGPRRERARARAPRRPARGARVSASRSVRTGRPSAATSQTTSIAAPRLSSSSATPIDAFGFRLGDAAEPWHYLVGPDAAVLVSPSTRVAAWWSSRTKRSPDDAVDERAGERRLAPRDWAERCPSARRSRRSRHPASPGGAGARASALAHRRRPCRPAAPGGDVDRETRSRSRRTYRRPPREDPRSRRRERASCGGSGDRDRSGRRTPIPVNGVGARDHAIATVEIRVRAETVPALPLPPAEAEAARPSPPEASAAADTREPPEAPSVLPRLPSLPRPRDHRRPRRHLGRFPETFPTRATSRLAVALDPAAFGRRGGAPESPTQTPRSRPGVVEARWRDRRARGGAASSASDARATCSLLLVEAREVKPATSSGLRTASRSLAPPAAASERRRRPEQTETPMGARTREPRICPSSRDTCRPDRAASGSPASAQD